MSAPDSRSIIVIGNGGGAFWRALKDHAARHPGWWQRDHPLDDFTREVIEREVAPSVRAVGVACRPIYPFDVMSINFMELGRIAGLGGPSILGVLVHPTYGPWIAFRAALLIDADLDSPGAASGFEPCPGCTVRSCIPACPVVRSASRRDGTSRDASSIAWRSSPTAPRDAIRVRDASSALSIATPTTLSPITRCAPCAQSAPTTENETTDEHR